MSPVNVLADEQINNRHILVLPNPEGSGKTQEKRPGRNFKKLVHKQVHYAIQTQETEDGLKIIIPCAGTSQRFLEAGYTDPKPLIKLGDGRPIISHVLDMFTEPDDEFVFVCNQDHLRDTKMASALYGLRRDIPPDFMPRTHIVSMLAHKLGPVHTVMAAEKHIKDDEQVIVAYCDGTMKWDRADFNRHVQAKNLDGCIFTHTGFHPHTLSSTKMAFVKPVLFGRGIISEVKEKSSYTDYPQGEQASSGIYWFRTGKLMKDTFRIMLDTPGFAFNGEFYVTLAYNVMIAAGYRVGYYETPQVAILGTPHEVQNFEAWRIIVKNPFLTNEADVLRCYRYWKEYHR